MFLRGLFRPWVLEQFLNIDEVAIVMNNQQAFLNAFLQGHHVIEGVAENITDKLVDNLTLTSGKSDLERLVNELQQYRDLGLSSVSLRLYESPAASIELIADRVLPHLK